MKAVTYLSLVLFLMLGFTLDLTAESPTNNVKFHAGSFESGMEKAQSEGKLLFVEFYADWCTPCKWMDKTTFKNDDVIDIMNEKYVALKLDIETDEGINLKNQHHVKMLPTIIIFNANGDVVERVEKTLSPESMVSLLSFHEAHEKRIVVTYPFNSSPNQQNAEEERQINELYNRYLSKENQRTNYKLQIANYTDYTEAFDKVNELSQIFMEPIIVINDYVNNLTHYKVMMGEFPTMSEAEGFRVILERDFGIDAIIY